MLPHYSQMLLRFGLVFFIIYLVEASTQSNSFPKEYKIHDPLVIKSVKLGSTRTHVPYDYYSLPFCAPDVLVEYPINLGQALRGERVYNTAYEISVLENVHCRLLCEKNISKSQANDFISRIEQYYSVQLQADGLPLVRELDGKQLSIALGYQLGFKENNRYFLNNHLQFGISYNEGESGTYRIVGFRVQSSSKMLSQFVFTNSRKENCRLIGTSDEMKNENRLEILPNKPQKIFFTYSVRWIPSKTPWSLRWKIYFHAQNRQIHWFSIFNSLVVIFFLSSVIAMILIRTLRRDIDRYNKYQDDMEEALEEGGWKLVHGDVFRPPKFPVLFSAVIGCGVQIILMLLLTIMFAMLGFLSPVSRGTVTTAGIFIFVFMGTFAGYSSGRLYKTLKGKKWKTVALYTSVMIPGFALSIFFILNFLSWIVSSSAAIPFSTVVAILALWLCISLPLVYLGGYFGHRKQPYQHPVRVNQIPRAVPPQKCYQNLLISMLLAGVLPFGAIFIELYFVFSALWDARYYYLFGFLFLVFVILVISCSQISIVLIYFQLCSENHHWWWRSFLLPAGTAVYVFLYCIFYYYTKSHVAKFIPFVLYFGYSSIIVMIFALLTGTIGFYSSYWFVRKIYAAIKID